MTSRPRNAHNPLDPIPLGWGWGANWSLLIEKTGNKWSSFFHHGESDQDTVQPGLTGHNWAPVVCSLPPSRHLSPWDSPQEDRAHCIPQMSTSCCERHRRTLLAPYTREAGMPHPRLLLRSSRLVGCPKKFTARGVAPHPDVCSPTLLCLLGALSTLMRLPGAFSVLCYLLGKCLLPSSSLGQRRSQYQSLSSLLSPFPLSPFPPVRVSVCLVAVMDGAQRQALFHRVRSPALHFLNIDNFSLLPISNNWLLI